MTPTVQFWFDGEQFVLDGELWDEFQEHFDERRGKGPNFAVAEGIVRDLADPVGVDAR